MANHKSALKRIRQNEKRRLRNRYSFKTTRNAIRELRRNTDAEAVTKSLPGVCAKIDKLVKKHIIHKNKAANLKSQLAVHAKTLESAS